jgi:hypothetical protein
MTKHNNYGTEVFLGGFLHKCFYRLTFLQLGLCVILNAVCFFPVGKATAKSSEVDLFGPNLMDDFIDASAATPATDSAVEPQADLFADADFQTATASAEAAANTDVQVCFSILCIHGKSSNSCVHSYNQVDYLEEDKYTENHASLLVPIKKKHIM